MKRLLLLRHAKSDWDDRSLADHDRPLSPRGERAAAMMGAWLAREAPAPDLVLCSSALRTVQTAERVLAQLDSPPPLETERALYLASTGAVLDRLHRVDAAVATCLVIGHNPTTEDLALALAGSAEEGLVERIQRKYPTGALAELHFEALQWRDLAPGGGHLVRFVRPKDL